jgi:3-dehydrosphinganine reductase
MAHTLITGGSSGIGLHIAALLVQRGESVTLLARDTAKLENARHVLQSQYPHSRPIHIIAADVCDFAALNADVMACIATQGAIDTLIASAGMITPGNFLDQSVTDFDLQIKTNLLGVANAIRAVYPSMIAAGAGRIMIVSSGAALLGIPGYASYCASKYGLRGLAAALRLEAKPKGVSVSICFPPDTDTPQFRQEIAQRGPETKLFLGPPKPWPVETVANRILKGMDARDGEIFFGFGMMMLDKLGPIIRPVLEKAYERRNKKNHTKKNKGTEHEAPQA